MLRGQAGRARWASLGAPLSLSQYNDLPPHKAVDKRFEDNFPRWRPKYEAMDQLSRFLSGERYVNDGGAFNRDRRGNQIRGQDIQDTIRHVVAKATEKPRSVEARPIDNGDDADVAEVMVGLVTNELADPYKGFERERYAAIQTCREMRMGCVWMDWVPDHGPYGEIFFGWQAPQRLMWDAPYHPHHPLCGWLIRDKRLDVDLARQDYKAEWLQPDRESLKSGGNWRQGVPLIAGYTDQIANYCQQDNKVTIRECWYKNDYTPGRDQLKDTEKLKAGQRYMSCKDGCGLKSDTQDTLKAMGAIKSALPEQIQSGCPTCGGNLMRIDAIDVNQTVLAYSRGRHLVVTAPFSPNPDDASVADGSWPLPKARSFPALFQIASVKPGDVYGPCDVDWMWDQQVAQDNLDTLAVQRVFEHRNYWIMPQAGILNYAGNRFEFRENDQNVMFRDMTKAQFGALDVQNINGTGLDPNWANVRSMVNANLTRYRPTGDIGLTQENSKDIAASTVAQLEQQGEVPTNDFIRRSNLELSMFYGVVADYITATYTPERIARINIEGADILLNLSGDDLPNYDFVVSETPDFTGIDKEKAQAFEQAMGVAAQFGPEALDAWGQFHNVPRTVIRSIQKLFAERAAAQDAAAMGGAPGAGMPGMEAPGAGPAPMMNGPNGNGAEPLPVA